jgi:hypothetical protein
VGEIDDGYADELAEASEQEYLQEKAIEEREAANERLRAAGDQLAEWIVSECSNLDAAQAVLAAWHEARGGGSRV